MANREAEIFNAALEQPTAAQRAAYLDSACAGEPRIRSRLEALLRAAATAGNFLADEPSGEPETPGTRIGSYRLRERIGEGGFGDVYLAEQDEPVRRTVALKIIKLGMDTRAVVARFEAERQALAMMEHPNIARVFDGGATGTGRPYFVMELVRGVPITSCCNRRGVSVRGRLELFLQVCSAVHHAHQKGIIHRDLKPANLLITCEETEPAVKVIDFGIAKATHEPLTEKTLQTRLHVLMGTPNYMSPEQVGLATGDIDTRSDIYALGAVLYELLTDAPAVDAQPLLAQGYAAVQRAIQHTEPPAPSQRVASLPPEEKSKTATRRGTTPTRLVAELRGDLDRIVLKCLEKDRRRRYETTEDLARDITRYLNNEPVLAQPPTPAYRASKFYRRHRRGVITAATVFALLAGFGIYHTQRLATERDRARLEAQKAAKVSELLTELLTASDPFRTPGGTGANTHEMVEAKVRQEFAGQPEVRAEILNAIGRVYLRRGENDRALPVLTEALAAGREIKPPDARLGDTLNHLGVLQRERGDFAAAERLLTEAVSLRRQLYGAGHNDVAVSLVELSRLQVELERLDRADPLSREALAIRQRVLGSEDRETVTSLGDLASVLWQKGDLNGAAALFDQNLAGNLRAIGPEHPNTAQSMANLAQVRIDQNDLAGAETLLRQAFAVSQRTIGPAHWRTARTEGALGDLLRRRKNFDEATQLLDEALRLARAAIGPDRPLVASLTIDRARVDLDRGDMAAAESRLREGLHLQRMFYPENGWRVASTKALLARALIALDRKDDAEALLTAANRVLKEIPGPQGRETKAARDQLAALTHVGP